MSTLPYATVAQLKYLEKKDVKEARAYRNAFYVNLEQIEKYQANLEQPEASWDLADLMDSGRKFPYNWFGETRYHIPNNTFLTGFNAFYHLRDAHAFCGGYAHAAWKDIAQCKEHLYLAAYCQERLCHWTEEDQNLVTLDFVSLGKFRFFLMGVLADADDCFLENLAQQLMRPEHNWPKMKRDHATGKGTIQLTFGKDKEARKNAEQLLALEEKAKRFTSPWARYAQGMLAILDQDEAALNIALELMLKQWRKADAPEIPTLLFPTVAGLAKLAVKRGLKVTVDTIDCPKELLQPVKADYSHLKLPAPKDGFPWERKPEAYKGEHR